MSVQNPRHNEPFHNEPGVVFPFIKDITEAGNTGFKDFRPRPVIEPELDDIPEEVALDIEAEYSEQDEVDPTVPPMENPPEGLEDLQSSSSATNPGENEPLAKASAPVVPPTPIHSSPSGVNPPQSPKQSADFALSPESASPTQIEQTLDMASGAEK